MFMSFRRITGLSAMLLLGVAAALALGVAPGGAARTSNSVTYQDSAGEDPASLDLTQIVVSNDDNGLLTVAASMNNAASLGGKNDFAIFIDSDLNSADGAGPNFEGAEMLIDVSDSEVDVAKWNGTKWDFSGGSPSSLVYSFTPGLMTVKVKAADLGLTKFNFFIGTDTDYSDSGSHLDFAPDAGHGTYSYEVKIAPPTTSTTTTTVKKKVVPKCKKGQKSTKARPCHK
jgi:hypothetical protein